MFCISRQMFALYINRLGSMNCHPHFRLKEVYNQF